MGDQPFGSRFCLKSERYWHRPRADWLSVRRVSQNSVLSHKQRSAQHLLSALINIDTSYITRDIQVIDFQQEVLIDFQ